MIRLDMQFGEARGKLFRACFCWRRPEAEIKTVGNKVGKLFPAAIVGLSSS